MQNIRLATGTDVLAAIPALLGFVPTDSVVMVALTERDGESPNSRFRRPHRRRKRRTDRPIPAGNRTAAANVTPIENRSRIRGRSVEQTLREIRGGDYKVNSRRGFRFDGQPLNNGYEVRIRDHPRVLGRLIGSSFHRRSFAWRVPIAHMPHLSMYQ